MSTGRTAFHLLLISVALLVASGCGSPYQFEPFAPRVTPALGEMKDGHAAIRLFYATDRRDTGAKAAALRFGVERTKDLTLGVGEVSIPQAHGRGRLEAPGLLQSPDPNEHVLLTTLSEPMAPGDVFWPRLRDAVALSKDHAVFVFVHGFFTSFDDAARRTALIAHDAEFDGVPIVYSWSSQQGFWGYLADRTNIEWTEGYLADFLQDLAERSGARRIHLMAHSMGTQALARAVLRVAAERDRAGKEPFAEVVLTAADIDAEIFARDYAKSLARLSQRITIYTSANDWALLGSQRINGYRRLGQLWPSQLEEDLKLYGRVDVIDASAVDKGLYGHIYYSESPRVLEDLEGIFKGKPASERELRKENSHFVIDTGGE